MVFFKPTNLKLVSWSRISKTIKPVIGKILPLPFWVDKIQGQHSKFVQKHGLVSSSEFFFFQWWPTTLGALKERIVLKHPAPKTKVWKKKTFTKL